MCQNIRSTGMTVLNNKIHPASHPDFENFDQNYCSLGFLEASKTSNYENYLVLNTPFHLPNTSKDVFSQLDYFKNGNYLKHIDPYVNDIREGRTKLVFFFVDWWGFCNDAEVSGKHSGNLITYDIYNWVYYHMKRLKLTEHSSFSSSVSTHNTTQHQDWPIVNYNEAFNRYLDHGNLLEHHDDIEFKNFMFYLNRRPRAHRLYALHQVYNAGLLDNAQYTFHFFDEGIQENLYNREDYIKKFLTGWIEPENINYNMLSAVQENFKHDHIYDSSNDVQTFDELKKLHQVSEGCFLELVVEYNCSDLKVFLTEKIARSIVLKKPFIVIGDQGALEEIKRYGFKTFNGVWDESYDQLSTAKERIDAVVKLLKQIKQGYWKTYDKQIQEIIDYNNHWYFTGYRNQQQLLFEKVFD